MKGKTLNSTGVPAEPYQWPHDGDLSLTTALVIIDMQNDCECHFFMQELPLRHCDV
jgi:hypothetical protein